MPSTRLAPRRSRTSFSCRSLPVACATLLAMLGAAPARSDDPAIPAIDPGPIRANIAELAADEMNGRSFRSEEGRRAAQWVAERLASAGAKPLAGRESMLVPVARMPQAAPNVVAWHAPTGPNPSGEYILVTAHFDHLPPKSSAKPGEDAIYNGADDNASGVCGMIAVAEALRGQALDVGVVFVGFTGEEAGLIGSRAFVDEETVPTARIRGVFNMDMISRQPDGAIRLDGGPKGKVLVDLLVRLAPKVPIEMKVDTHPDWLSRSDQGAFLARDIPAVLFSCEDHEDYHRVTDHADKTDAVLAAKVASLVAAAVGTYAREMTPRFDRSPVLADDGTQRRTLRVGRTMPNPPYWKPATRRDTDRGAEARLVEALAGATGLRVEEKQLAPGGEVEALEAGEVDLVANGLLESHPGLAAAVAAGRIAVAATFVDGGIGALVAKASPIDDAGDLRNPTRTVRLAVRPGSAGAAWVEAQVAAWRANGSSSSAATAPLEAVATSEPEGTVAGRVEKGELDALVGDARALAVRAARDASVRVVPLAGARTVVAVRAADAALAERIARGLAALNDNGAIRSIESSIGGTRRDAARGES